VAKPWKSVVTGLSSMNRHAEVIHAGGHDRRGAGVNRKWSGLIHHHHHRNMIQIQLRLKWLREQQQERHLS
jgi:hypothetical protein